MSNLYFDIETSGLPIEERLPFRPSFTAPSNYKDESKIKAAIEEREKAWDESAPLSALTGKVLCVGMWTEKKGFHILESSDESDVIQSVLDCIQSNLQMGNKVVGFAIKSFDLPFLIQRAYRLGVHVPKALYEGHWYNSDLIDLAEVWSGPGNRDMISLDHLAKALGVGAKTGKGKDFADLWEGDRQMAVEYLERDILLSRLCAEKMGIV